MTAQEKSAAWNDFFIGSLSVIELGKSVVRETNGSVESDRSGTLPNAGECEDFVSPRR
jgi:hypothetical protein